MVKQPLAYFVRLKNNALLGKEVVEIQRTVGQLSHIFIDASEAKKMNETIAYRVRSINNHLEDGLQFGVTYLNPLKVSGEFNMTHGHYHLDKSHGEIYFGLSGNGLLMMWDGVNDVWCEEVFDGSVHLIQGKYAHRLINTSNEVLTVGAIWSTKAGYDYGSIDTTGFPQRVFEVDGKIEIRLAKEQND